ncbi:cache domain-containing protein [Anoxybacillus geothermalis]|uniref:cache domain-containing protein n=1 Tax=Geobacillus stearothermophilus TaxID=1422 RepID=UPI002E98A4EB|nr:cache domain-containing protein [Anoxybacillus geothermalis]
MIFCIIILLTIVLTAAAIIQIKKGIQKETLERVKSSLSLAYHYLDEKYEGSWAVKNGALYKGSEKINGNNQLVDEIGNLTGGTATIFQNETRVATNIIVNNRRAVGTTAPPEVVEQVLKKGNTFFREVNILHQWYQVAYMPIKNDRDVLCGDSPNICGHSRVFPFENIDPFCRHYTRDGISSHNMVLASHPCSIGRRLQRPPASREWRLYGCHQ